MTEERIFSVYIHKFPNGKQYVGMTRTEPKRRWANGKGYKNNPTMSNDINLYGWNNIEHILFNDEGILYTEEEACYIEKNLVSSWDLTNPNKGYNRTIGGTSSYRLFKSSREKISNSLKKSVAKKPVVQYDKDGTKVAEYLSMAEASAKLKIDNSAIAKCCKGTQKTSGGYRWRLKKDNIKKLKPIEIKPLKPLKPLKQKNIITKPVVQYSLDGIKIAEFNSITEADRLTNANFSGISNCCKGTLKTSGGYRWRFKKDNIQKLKPIEIKTQLLNSRFKPVVQYSLDGTKIAEYLSMAEAGRATNINSRNISRVCINNKRRITGGFKWKYRD